MPLSMALACSEARLSAPPGLQDLSPVTPAPLWPCGPDALARPVLASGEPVKLARTAAGRLTLATMDGMLATLAVAKPTLSEGVASTCSGTPSPASQASDCNESVGSAHEEPQEQTKKKRSRFCKAKRDHYRRLVEDLVERFRENPGSCTLDAVKLPKSIACSQEARDKLLATVAKFSTVGGEA